jgi:hypothetical protein
MADGRREDESYDGQQERVERMRHMSDGRTVLVLLDMGLNTRLTNSC